MFGLLFGMVVGGYLQAFGAWSWRVDGLGNVCRFIGVGVLVVGALGAGFDVGLVNVRHVVVARMFAGSLRAGFVEVRAGDGCSWNVNVVAKDNWGLDIGFKKGGQGLLLRLLVGTERGKTDGGHSWG